MRGGGTIFGAIAMLSLAAPGAAAPPHLYAVARIGSVLDDASVIGRKRIGLACFPNGVVRWHDVATREAMDARETVQDALEDAGVRVTPLGTAAAAPERLRGTVREASFDVCARRVGLGDAKAFGGSVGLVVEWRLEGDGGDAPRTHLSTVTRTVSSSEAAPLQTLYRRLLGDAARDAAAWLSAGPG